MNEQQIAPVQSEQAWAAYRIGQRSADHTAKQVFCEVFDRYVDQAVLAHAGAVRDQALQDAVTELEKRRRLLHGQFEALNISDADAVYGICIDAIRALKGTPAAAVAELPEGLTVKQAWWAGYRAGKGLAPDTPRQEAMRASVHCPKCGANADVKISGAHVVTHWPDGTPRDERDIASDPEGVLIHDPAMPLRAATQPSTNPGPLAAGELPEWWDDFINNVCELPDRNSPADEPDAMIATAEELVNAALVAIAASKEGAAS